MTDYSDLRSLHFQNRTGVQRVLASLNHPNIAAIHGLEEADGTRALVLELVDGVTLAERITQGPIPLDEALPIAKQIAEALEEGGPLGGANFYRTRCLLKTTSPKTSRASKTGR